jgi:hypothetical protein
MKAILLSLSLLISFSLVKAQDAQVQSLPAGKYETAFKNSESRWERGDIIILDENRYKVSSSDEVGDYKFSRVAQRIFFISGPLKSIFAKTSLNKNNPAIVLPVEENEPLGLKLSSDVWCYYKH